MASLGEAGVTDPGYNRRSDMEKQLTIEQHDPPCLKERIFLDVPSQNFSSCVPYENSTYGAI